MDQKVHILALQKKTYASPRENMDAVRDMLDQYKGEMPDFLLLPEIFTCPYDNSQFPLFAQKDGDSVYCFLSELAWTNHFYVIGGSVELIGKHRKVHLFDIDVPGGQYFKESDVLSPGKEMTVFDTEYGRMGVCICFDIRFPDLFLQMRRAGVRMVFVPAAFNMTTGPAHWQTLFRSRALDQQIFMAGCSPARDETASYIAYGHSIVTDPWGRILKELDEKEGILDIELDLAETDRIRTQIPLGQ